MDYDEFYENGKQHNYDNTNRILPYGKQVSYAEFLRQLNEIESDYDREQDNFIPLLCRRYGWMIIETSDIPAYVYDRDIRRAYQVKRD